jgi:hypothetical protein
MTWASHRTLTNDGLYIVSLEYQWKSVICWQKSIDKVSYYTNNKRTEQSVHVREVSVLSKSPKDNLTFKIPF